MQWPLTNLKGHSVQHAQLPQNFFMAGLPYRSTCPCFSAFRCLSSALSIGSAPTSPSPHCASWRRRRRPLRPFRSTGWAGRQASTPPVEAKSAVSLASCGCQETSISAKHSKFLSAVPIDFPNICVYIYIYIILCMPTNPGDWATLGKNQLISGQRLDVLRPPAGSRKFLTEGVAQQDLGPASHPPRRLLIGFHCSDGFAGRNHWKIIRLSDDAPQISSNFPTNVESKKRWFSSDSPLKNSSPVWITVPTYQSCQITSRGSGSPRPIGLWVLLAWVEYP